MQRPDHIIPLLFLFQLKAWRIPCDTGKEGVQTDAETVSGSIELIKSKTMYLPHLHTFKAGPGNTVKQKIYFVYKNIYSVNQRKKRLIILSARVPVQKWSFPVQHHPNLHLFSWSQTSEGWELRRTAPILLPCCTLDAHSIAPCQILPEVRLRANLLSLCHGHGLGSLFHHSLHGLCLQPRAEYGNSLWTC